MGAGCVQREKKIVLNFESMAFMWGYSSESMYSLTDSQDDSG